MKISLDWLSDFIERTEKDPQVIADQLTRRMGEVDAVHIQGASLDSCVVGKVLTVEKHPDADKLSVCTVQTEQGTKTVVCGGTNVRANMLVAFAHIGATVKWHGGETMTLGRVKIRGVESEGMICAQEELDLTCFPAKPEDGPRPITDLSTFHFPFSTSPVGTPLREALGLTDTILCIDNHAITNRPDLFSHVGVARELVAMGLATWKKQPKNIAPKFPSAATPFKLVNDVKNLVPYYNGCLLTLENIPSSPDWMKRRLEATGWRSINLVVDITNYVLLEIGMPLHAFDADDFKGDLHIRAAKKGEKIRTLDDIDRALPEGAVIMSDDQGVFDLFGIMGGKHTSMKPTTKRIFLQAGIIDPAAVRRTVIAMAHRTDAATVYEKGVLPTTSDAGLHRAIELFLSLAQGTKISSKRVTWGSVAKAKPVKISADRIRDFIGSPIKTADIKKILSDLGCEVKATGETLSMTPPAWRRDLTHAQDMIEEVARVYGYANIAPVMPDASIVPPDRETRIHLLRDALSESGATEMLHLAFTSPEQCKKWKLPLEGAINIENPIGEEISLMRMCLVPSLVETASRELRNTTNSHLKTFEVGHTFSVHGEKNMCALAVITRGKTTLKDSPILIAKADILSALKAAGYSASVRQAKPTAPYAHDGRNAEIVCKNTVIGSLFEIHPMIGTSLDAKGRIGAAVLDLDALLKIKPDVIVASALPVFPAIELDETIPISDKRTHGALMTALKSIDPLLEKIETVDVYEKETLRTISLRFTYRANDRTLTQQEVEKMHAKVLAELKK